MDNYRVRLWNYEGKCVFSREGRFKNDDDALEHVYGFPFQKHILAANEAFLLSGGLTRNYYEMKEFTKIELINNSIRKTTFYKSITYE